MALVRSRGRAAHATVRAGYKRNRVDQFADDLNPALALLADWTVTSGNTAQSIDMLVSCFDQMQRHDVVDVIAKKEGSFSDACRCAVIGGSRATCK